ncbi:MAG: hypothetical protein EKK53_27905 [Burkholderiales bacterium]|nr:MAG: hypothetical protein EKK53_27905 [Burkholderiales bacterium]
MILPLDLDAASLLELGGTFDAGEYQRRLVRLANCLGFPLISGAVLTTDIRDPSVKIQSFGNTPPDYEAAALDIDMARADPVMNHLMASRAPMTYNRKVYHDAGLDMMWEHQAPYGYANGVALKVPLSAGRSFVVGVDTGDELPKDEQRLGEIVTGVQLIAFNASVAAEGIFHAHLQAELPRLTPKERSVMQWTLAGKTAWEIGRILSMSENTVRYHTANVLKKANVSTKQQAALKYSNAGLLG